MTMASSLFDAPPGAVFPAATDWLTGTLFGSVATGLCVIAVAFIGFRLMTGHLAIRDGFRVAIGSFVLLGAPIIAAGLLSLISQPEQPGRTIVAAPALPEVSRPYDPYLGASINWHGFQAPQEQPTSPTPQAPP